jgi:hypothetical protein
MEASLATLMGTGDQDSLPGVFYSVEWTEAEQLRRVHLCLSEPGLAFFVRLYECMFGGEWIK